MTRPTYLALATLCVAIPMHSQATPSADQTAAAVKVVTKTYVPNPLAKVEGSKTGLPSNGSWGARAAIAEERTPECDTAGSVCVAALYHGVNGIVCRWTVLFAPGATSGHVISQSTASSTYMLRAIPLGDPDAPLLLSGQAPDTPPIAQVTHMVGMVRERLYVDPSGAVQGSVISYTTNPIFTNAVLNVSKMWKLQPVTVNGDPVWAQIDVTINFSGSMSSLSLKRTN